MFIWGSRAEVYVQLLFRTLGSSSHSSEAVHRIATHIASPRGDKIGYRLYILHTYLGSTLAKCVAYSIKSSYVRNEIADPTGSYICSSFLENDFISLESSTNLVSLHS